MTERPAHEPDPAEELTWTIGRWLSRVGLIIFVPAAIVFAALVFVSGGDSDAFMRGFITFVPASIAIQQCVLRRRKGHRW